ncbi:MAG: IS110 family RNA-guided transposase [Burkholderiales bacterium]
MKSANQSYAAFVGIDWADQKHDVCLKAAGSDGCEREVIAHRPEAIERWAHGLRKRFAGQPIAVCLEIARGPLVSALQRYEFLVLFPVNPSTLASYRSTFCVSGAKDDPTDAELALELLLRHPEKLSVLRPQSAAMRKLEKLVEQRRMLVDEVHRVTNRMGAALKEYFPQVLEWFKDKDTLVFCEFVTRWPTLKQAQRARKARLCAFFHEHNVRYRHIVEQRVQSIMAASPLTSDASVIDPNRLLVVSLAQQLRVLLQSVERFDLEIAAVAPTLADYDLFAGLPGAGPVFAPRLLAAFGEQRERFDNANRMQSYVGVAPVTERSGNKCWVHWRLRCPKFVRQTFVEWAAHSIPYCYWAEAYYRQQRAKGSSHQAALRALAFKWIRIVYRCWQTRTPYDEATYLSALKRRGSPLIA